MAKLALLFDIGTTTISGSILDIEKKRLLSGNLVLNGQAKFGDDLVSRIDFALKKQQNASLLQKRVSSSINKLIKLLLSESRSRVKDVASVFCVANSAMHHLFLGIDTSTLITPPYRARQKSEITAYAKMLGLNLGKDVQITFLPNIAGFVGSDALSVILASGIYKERGVQLAIDIGTNGEVILGNKDRILVASTAAGPAFEAKYARHGMPAVKGAIKSVAIKKGRPAFSVIGGGTPKGITGSGLIDACYAALKTGAMDKSGKMKEKEFVIFKRGKKTLSITQNDIRKLQLAKAAIFAATKILLRRYGIEPAAIDRILLTGSFGSSLNKKSVSGAGLIPRIDIRKVHCLNNAALEGLFLYAADSALRKQLLAILSRIEHVPLLGKSFSDEFVSSLAFGVACQ